MKAAVLNELGEAPRYLDFPDPVLANANEVVIKVKAAAVKNFDRGRASGSHYGSYTQLPVVVGIDGVGLTEDGTKVYAVGVGGMIAEKALVDKHRMVKVPAGLDDAIAAALPNAVLGAGLALRAKANIKPGETVLVNGATGVTGTLAVQIAKHYGAKKVIATGRNPESLKKLSGLGADEIISLKQTDEQITEQIKALHSSTPLDIVIDYTWGHPAELILAALKGSGVNSYSHRVRYVSVGSMAGYNIQLFSDILRSSAIEISGSGLGSHSREAMQKLFTELVPEMFQLAADGKLRIETVTVPLKDIEKAWDMEVPPGTRLVIRI